MSSALLATCACATMLVLLPVFFVAMFRLIIWLLGDVDGPDLFYD